ncbi:hypothetical protein DBV15_08958 [Temnothorax longispinosus]|uniref:Uncharacterized protein n=1 Tax=Temnothorax longispinosus TaxID=300112 RepID=A0A4S2KNR1_9HYME|nr:hypothetical protein DBV15_08958 [Temnothorax longispinosus]
MAMVVVFIYSHTQFDFGNQAVRRFSAVRRLIVTQGLAPIGPAIIIISQVSTVTNMSIPLQADLSSVVEKGAMSRRDIANFWVNQQLHGRDIWAGRWDCAKKNAVYMKKRG